MSAIEGKRPFVVIGTSGASDYLKDTTGDQRFWPLTPSCVGIPPADTENRDEAVVARLLELTGGTWLDDAAGEGCDGLHDESAPSQYLCSRCFPKLRGDLAEPHNDDEYDEARRDEDQAME